MAESIVSDWIADYGALTEQSEIRTFAAQHEHNHEIASALFTIINERLKYPDVIHSICNQLFSYYRSSETELKRFTLQFIPTLIYTYLNAVAQGDKKSCRSVETLLLGMYNIEVSNEDGQPKVVSFRMPVLAQASIYHEEKSLNASDLRRWEENSNKEVTWGPLPHYETINAQNRLRVMSALMFVYNQHISLIPKSSLSHLCRISSQLVNQGFAKYGHAHRSSYGNDPTAGIVPKPLPRIPMSTQLLLELLTAIYFAMFNEFASIAIQTVDDIHNRACYELYTEVIIVTNAIKNSLHANPSGQPSDGPMGLSVALTPSTHTVTISKSMITNASFRTKKLPDDIPIQAGDESTSANNQSQLNQLLSITEESESADPQIGTRNNLVRSSKEILRTHKVPFSGFKKSKDKDKEKETSSNSANATNKNQQTKNGGLFSTDGNKDSVIIAATKQLMKKEKKASMQAASIDATDIITHNDKTSPLLQIKRKSASIDVTPNGPITSTIDIVQMQTFANGNSVIVEEKMVDVLINSTTLTTLESGDHMSPEQCSTSESNNGPQRNSMIIDHNNSKSTSLNNMQISQV